ncbi:MAG: hypothetical protein HQL51_12405 [Magnetococcales bacterium]|nr:hypothetical protein [Magnetococcales bacterium]
MIDSPAPRSTWKHALGWALLAGCALLAVESAMMWNVENIAQMKSRSGRAMGNVWMQVAQRVKTMQGPPADVLFLGDSTVMASINEEEFARVSGLKGLNLGTGAVYHALGDYSMLRLYLERFPPPSAVVFWHTFPTYNRRFSVPHYAFMAQPSLMEASHYLWPKRLREMGAWSHARTWQKAFLLTMLSVRHAEDLMRVAAMRLPSYRMRDNIVEALNDELPLRSPTERIETGPPTSEEEMVERFEKHHGKSRQALFTFEEHIFEWMERLVALCHDHHIRVYYGAAPVHRGLMEHPSAGLVVKSLQSQLSLLVQSRFPEVQLIAQDNPVFESGWKDDKYDFNHPDEAGARRITQNIAALLKEALAQPAN